MAAADLPRAFTATGATIGAASRVDERDDLWQIRITPTGIDPITLTMNAPSDCSAAGAPCTHNDRPLSEAITLNIAGPHWLEGVFSRTPPEHDGETAFEAEVRFTRAITASPDTFHRAFGVEGGSATQAQPVNDQRDHWKITLAPSGNGRMKISLAVDQAQAKGPDGETQIPMAEPLLVYVPGPNPIAIEDASAEAATGASITFTVTLGRWSAQTITVDYATSNGTASSGEDYTATSGTLSFGLRETSKTISVPLLANTGGEEEETFTVTLSNPSSGYLKDATATGTISVPSTTVEEPTDEIDSTTVEELTAEIDSAPQEHDGVANIEVRVAFSASIQNRWQYVHWAAGATTGGTSVAAKRHQGRSDLWRFFIRPAGNGNVHFKITGGGICAGPNSKVLCTSQGQVLSEPVSVTILGPAAISVSDASATGGASSASFPVTLSRAAIGDVTVNYATSNGTATAGEDYTATSGSLTFKEGEQTKTVAVPILADAGTDETFTLTLSGATGTAYIKDASASATITSPPPNNPATGAPVITGTAEVGQTLTAGISGISDEDGLTTVSYTYQWQADGVDISGAAASTYTLTSDEDGKAITVKVTFTDDLGHDESLTSAATAAVTTRPNSPATGLPTVSGTEQVGETLTADISGISDEDGLENVTWTYQWVRTDGSTIAIIGYATRSTYTLSTYDQGKMLKVIVRFTDDRGFAEFQSSALTGTIAARPNRAATGSVTVSGTAQVGQTLTADISGVQDQDGIKAGTFTYQWHADNAQIDGATASSYTLTADEEGKTVHVSISFQDNSGHTETMTSAATAAVTAAEEDEVQGESDPPANNPAAGKPAVTGTAQVGQTLTAGVSGISDQDGLTDVEYAYQWLRDGTDIDGATSSTYTLAAGDKGKAISVKVSFTDDLGNPESLTSDATAAVLGPPLTVTLDTVPDSHQGSGTFIFTMSFSEEPKTGFSFKVLRDHAFTVTGGKVKKASRLDAPSNIGWKITIEPYGDGDVRIQLPATTSCSASGAVCTNDGRKLSNSLDFTVAGPG